MFWIRNKHKSLAAAVGDVRRNRLPLSTASDFDHLRVVLVSARTPSDPFLPHARG